SQSCTKQDIQSQIKLFSQPSKLQLARQSVLQCGEAAITPLIDAMSGTEAVIRVESAISLGKMKATAQDAVSALVNALEDSEEKVRTEATSSLIEIGEAVKNEPINFWDVEGVQKLKTIEQKLAESQKKLAADKRNWLSKDKDIENLRLINNVLTNKLSKLEENPSYQTIQWVQANPWIWLVFSGMVVYLSIFSFKPLWLLKLDRWVKPASFTIPWINLPISLGNLSFLKYHPRVLDCWVAQHFDQVKDKFLHTPTVSEREIHIPILVKLNDKDISCLQPKDLSLVFSKSPAWLVIVGEGGVGKTSLAYQIARWGLGIIKEEDPENKPICSHLMLPILIEQELENRSLLNAIAEQLPRTPDGNYIDAELLAVLLKRQRILLILDHVSEISDPTYNKLQEALTQTPVNALIITSRLKEKNLGLPQQTWLEPQKIQGARLSNFIQPYLEAQNKRDIFEDDEEFYRTCTRLASMMAATLQSATALLVRMYVDQVIELGGLKTAQLPDNIPDLMLKYLEWLNRDTAIDKAVRRDDAEVLQAAKSIAWECLKDNYYPAEAKYEAVIQAIKALNQTGNSDQEAKNQLTYLEKTLLLVQRRANRVRIILDPVAEYLAAFQVVEYCQNSEGASWEQFFQTVDTKPDLGQIRGFLLAVRNCCEQKGKKLPQGVLDALNQRANLNPEELEQVRRRQRINRLIDDLYDAEPKYLGQAIRNLKEEGTYAHKAIPDLLKVLKSEKIEAVLRVEALNALMQIQSDIEKLDVLCREMLAERGDRSEVQIRVAAIANLLQLRRDRDGLRELLTGYFQDATEEGVVRVQAGEGLRKLGVLQGLLVVELSEAAVPTLRQLPTPKTWKLQLPGDIELVMVPIRGGSFWMGSPPGEGFNVERPQHPVTVADFWMGQFPVTQAQYEAVMGRNPASFQENGRNRPVETISWHDAIAFCERLSELTGQKFRLPTEAEWEYACRSVTSYQSSVISENLSLDEWNEKYHQPFSFGQTITTDYANYRGTDWNYGGTIYSGAYGKGPKGIFREQTTEVGSFPPNAFGLYDMHGNVWEWCLDDWHDNYEGAPANGREWLNENNSQSKLLRGGSWSNLPDFCRCAYRLRYIPAYRGNYLGLRLVASSRT
ncbi:MAG: SUMF1/EgtB/PvdO family nonheme iron enzyme, partial [Sphaerospermopsis kisseleviana]